MEGEGGGEREREGEGGGERDQAKSSFTKTT